MALPIEEVLAEWREAERRRDELPPGDPQRDEIDRRIRGLRRMYRSLARSTASSYAAIDDARDHIEASRAVLRDAFEAMEEDRQRPTGDGTSEPAPI